VQGILLAVHDRHRTGLGQHVDIALFDSILSVMRLPLGILLATGEAPQRVGNEHPSIAPYETLNTPEGQVIVAVGNPRLWKQFCAAIERDDLVGDPRFATNADRLANRAELKATLEAAFERYSLPDLIARLEAHKVPCGRVRTIVDAIANDQVAAREMIVTLRDADLRQIVNLGTPIKLSRTPAELTSPPPKLGEHTDEVLSALDDREPRVAARR
jgi:crotonobetainyl-CoA:carnitine CoA-transferase CaiB-like acyl-CoA transferase